MGPPPVDTPSDLSTAETVSEAGAQNLEEKYNEVVGDLAAPSYFAVDASGNVVVSSSLKHDIATEYRLRVDVSQTYYFIILGYNFTLLFT